MPKYKPVNIDDRSVQFQYTTTPSNANYLEDDYPPGAEISKNRYSIKLSGSASKLTGPTKSTQAYTTENSGDISPIKSYVRNADGSRQLAQSTLLLPTLKR